MYLNSTPLLKITETTCLTHDDIGEPGRKPDFSYEVCLEELVNFFFDDFMSFFSHLLFLL